MLFVLAFLFVLKILFFNIDRSVFELNVHFCKVFSDDAEAKEDHTAHKEEQNDDAGIAGDVNAEAELLYDGNDHINERDKG